MTSFTYIEKKGPAMYIETNPRRNHPSFLYTSHAGSQREKKAINIIFPNERRERPSSSFFFVDGFSLNNGPCRMYVVMDATIDWYRLYMSLSVCTTTRPNGLQAICLPRYTKYEKFFFFSFSIFFFFRLLFCIIF